MPTQRNGYFTQDGTRVPSVTTIIGRFKDAGPLMYWAWEQGKAGKDFRETRDAAATAGTLAHEAVEAHIRHEPCLLDFTPDEDTPEVMGRAHRAYQAFLAWERQTQLKVEQTELPLVSEQHRFGGTFDAILVNGARAVGDWKTSNGLYPDYLLQVAAYGKLWEENFPDQPITGGFHLLRFDKTYGDFSHHWWGELDAAWEAFLHLRALYELEKELKQRAK